MSDKERSLTDAQLEAAFDAMRRQPAEPTADLMARILTDAETVSAAQSEVIAVPFATPRSNWVQRLLSGLGGMPALAGLAAVACVGVGIGLNPPAVIEGLEASLFGTADVYVLDMLPDLQGDLIDG